MKTTNPLIALKYTYHSLQDHGNLLQHFSFIIPNPIMTLPRRDSETWSSREYNIPLGKIRYSCSEERQNTLKKCSNIEQSSH